MDETWVLYDRQLVDDELYKIWSKFKPGVRILVLSDSCHSGTVPRDIPAFLGNGPRPRAMPRADQAPDSLPCVLYSFGSLLMFWPVL